MIAAGANLPSHAQENPTRNEAALVEAENQVSAKRGSNSWQKAMPILPLANGDQVQTGELSRAVVRLTDSSMLRLDELTRIEIVRPARESNRATLDLSAGAMYFFSREKPRELEIRTPAATGALRGTEFVMRVGSGGRTQVTMMDGEVELTNSAGSVLLRSGEQGEAEPGKAPHKTAVIEATNIIQWALYYPGVLDVRELGLTDEEQRMLSASLAAYREGDLLGALEKYPASYRSRSRSGQLYRAAVLLAVGRVDDAQEEMATIAKNAPGRFALEQMIAAVKFQEWPSNNNLATAGQWMAESYYQQSRSNLEGALQAAKKAAEISPEFGFAWARVAELEFSFGRTPQAIRDVEHSLELAPRNAQAHALKGYLFSAQNRIAKARESFDQAIRLDGALGNAWLGRGLTFIRQGQYEAGRRDLQTAAVLEPNRSIFRSYLGKAFSEVGSDIKAKSELTRAQQLDPSDPTPWLYSAIQHKQENRYNEAVDDLEKSIELNDNRRVYRSQFLLDQDRSIRGTNLASIFLNDGMREQSVREAVRAVDDDYSSAPAHLFLANSYNALRDPTRILLRYETAWFNELLLSNLLSPVGGGPLSQFVSEQEYSKMFEHDGLGLSSVTDYFSYGEVRETGSQYGTFGNISYALDAEYQYNDGIRPNNRISRLESYGQVKLQLGPQDTLFFQTKYEDLQAGDVFQHYDPIRPDPSLRTAFLTFDFHERQDPALLLFGWHHEWAPGNHTLVLVGRLASRQTISFQDGNNIVIERNAPPSARGLIADSEEPDHVVDNSLAFETLRALTSGSQITNILPAQSDLDYHTNFETYTAELQHIATLGPNSIVIGGRYQSGQLDTNDRLTNIKVDRNTVLFDFPAVHQDFNVSLERINLYLYNTWRIAAWLSVTGGVTYDDLHYPDNFRSAPINNGEREVERVSPKAGFILQPARGTVLRGAYAQAISGVAFDETVRLEPTQIDGFTQAYRTILSENLVGSIAGSKYELWGLSLEQKLPTRTFLGAEFNRLRQSFNQTIGAFDVPQSGLGGLIPSSLEATDNYREDIFTATVNQLVGDNWSLGVRYRYTDSHFHELLPELKKAGFPDAAEQRRQSDLHELGIFAFYNHPSGFFATGEARWYKQHNDTSTNVALTTGPGDDFWQFNVIAGWRFFRNQCEISCGCLNINDTDYKLDPLNPYVELPRSRTLMVRAKISF